MPKTSSPNSSSADKVLHTETKKQPSRLASPVKEVKASSTDSASSLHHSRLKVAEKLIRKASLIARGAEPGEHEGYLLGGCDWCALTYPSDSMNRLQCDFCVGDDMVCKGCFRKGVFKTWLPDFANNYEDPDAETDWTMRQDGVTRYAYACSMCRYENYKKDQDSEGGEEGIASADAPPEDTKTLSPFRPSFLGDHDDEAGSDLCDRCLVQVQKPTYILCSIEGCENVDLLCPTCDSPQTHASCDEYMRDSPRKVLAVIRDEEGRASRLSVGRSRYVCLSCQHESADKETWRNDMEKALPGCPEPDVEGDLQ